MNPFIDKVISLLPYFNGNAVFGIVLLSILVFFLKLCIVWEVCKDRGDVGAAGDIGKSRGNVGEP